MASTIYSDQSRQLNWYVRENTDATLTITVTENSLAFNLSSYIFIWECFRVGYSTPILSLTQGSGITNGGISGVLTLSLTNTQLSISPDQYYWRLRSSSPSDSIWLNGMFVVNGYLWDGGANSNASLSISLGANNVALSINLSDNPELAKVSYSTTFTFDADKEIYQDLTGSSPTITLSSTGARNGTVIIFRANKPTAIMFSGVVSEASSSSATLDATKLNVYSLIYFSNWNNTGTPRVIYTNSLFASV